jgi:anti-sigma factor RsiW
MDCRETQERLLESLDRLLAPQEKSQLEGHIAACPECAQFADLQSQLDVRLREAIAAPQLSSGFRAALLARIAQEPRERWPDWLPDMAFLAGSGLAVASCALLLPVPVPVVLGTGVVVAFLAYSVQTLLISVLEQRTD